MTKQNWFFCIVCALLSQYMNTCVIFSIINFSSHQIHSFHFDSFHLCMHLHSFIVSLTTSVFSVSTCILEHLPVRRCYVVFSNLSNSLIRDGSVLHLTVLGLRCVRGGSNTCTMPHCLLAPRTALPDPAALELQPCCPTLLHLLASWHSSLPAPWPIFFSATWPHRYCSAALPVALPQGEWGRLEIHGKSSTRGDL